MQRKKTKNRPSATLITNLKKIEKKGREVKDSSQPASFSNGWRIQNEGPKNIRLAPCRYRRTPSTRMTMTTKCLANGSEAIVIKLARLMCR